MDLEAVIPAVVGRAERARLPAEQGAKLLQGELEVPSAHFPGLAGVVLAARLDGLRRYLDH